ncbi:MAG TPA: F0F1 ATP synthase subunit B [Acidimicrobiia bacterium]|nr:F0F1 ATP synthase subunit B [Acidimicrobiia bacterium]
MLYALSTVLLAAEEAEETGNIGLVLPEPYELVAGIIAFGIVFFFVWKWAFPAIDKMLEDRQRAIKGQMEDAEAAKAEAQSLLDDYRKQLAEAKAEAAGIINEAREAAEAMKADILAKAQTESAEIGTKARADAATERDRALASARVEVANLSIDLAERVVGENLDRAAQLGLVERYLADLERMSD